MSIISSNNADYKSLIRDWLGKNVSNSIRYNLGKASNIIDVRGEVIIEGYHKTILPHYVKFGEINGNFKCINCKISSMEGFPRKVDGDFICSNCKNITSVEEMPKYVNGNCSISNCGRIFSEEEIMHVCDVTGEISCL